MAKQARLLLLKKIKSVQIPRIELTNQQHTPQEESRR
jgi:hypothetical protein